MRTATTPCTPAPPACTASTAWAVAVRAVSSLLPPDIFQETPLQRMEVVGDLSAVTPFQEVARTVEGQRASR